MMEAKNKIVCPFFGNYFKDFDKNIGHVEELNTRFKYIFNMPNGATKLKLMKEWLAELGRVIDKWKRLESMNQEEFNSLPEKDQVSLLEEGLELFIESYPDTGKTLSTCPITGYTMNRG